MFKKVEYNKLGPYESIFSGKEHQEYRLNTDMAKAHSYLYSLIKQKLHTIT